MLILYQLMLLSEGILCRDALQAMHTGHSTLVLFDAAYGIPF